MNATSASRFARGSALSRSLVGFAANGRQLASRPVKGIDKTTDFNVQLWRLAEEFAS